MAIGGAGQRVGLDGEAFEDWAQVEGRASQEIPLPADLALCACAVEAVAGDQVPSELLTRVGRVGCPRICADDRN
jgi:hypothetical protein